MSADQVQDAPGFVMFRRLLCLLGFHRVHAYPSDEFDVFMCRYCDWEGDY